MSPWLMTAQGSRGASRNTARPTPNPTSPSTPTTTRGKPMWIPTSVRLSRIRSKVTQPLQPRPRVIRLRIATTLLGAAAQAAAADDLAWLAAYPDIEQHGGPHPVGSPHLSTLVNGRPVRRVSQTVKQLDRARGEIVIRDRIDEPRAPHQDALREERTDSRQGAQLLQRLQLRERPEPRWVERARKRGSRHLVKTFELYGRDAGKALDPKQRAWIGERLEAAARDLDRCARFLRHALPDAARLKDRDPVPDDERASRLVGRVKEHGPKVSIGRLQSADHGVPPSDLDEAIAVDIERDGRQRPAPGPFGLIADAIDLTQDRRLALAHHHGRRTIPALHGERHDDAVAEPRPAAETLSLRFQLERSLGTHLESPDRRDGAYSSGIAGAP